MKNMKEDKKYKILEDDFIIHKGKKLYRIEALKKFYTFEGVLVFEGYIGGYVEGYHNLSQEGYCWVDDNSRVYDNARVKDDATVAGGAEVYENASIENYAIVGGDAVVFGNARIKDCAVVRDHAKIFGNARVIGCAGVKGKAKVYDNAVVKAEVACNNKICGNAEVWCIYNSPLDDEEFSGNSKLV